jgi:hypothetical protein
MNLGNKCETCRHFRETVDKPTPASQGACAWLPKWQPVSRRHDCGQWKKAGGAPR